MNPALQLLARNGFSPSSPQYAVSCAGSKSNKLMSAVMRFSFLHPAPQHFVAQGDNF
jgi:hypothetical protein